MDPKFKPYKTGMIDVLERCPCGKNGGKGKPLVYYICKCECGKEFVLTGDELSKHPYSCGCTPKPSKKGTHPNEYALGIENGTMAAMLKKTKKVRSNSKSGVTGVYWDPRRSKWRAWIAFQGKKHELGYYYTKEEAIAARVEAEKKYFETYLKGLEEKKNGGR